MVSIDVSAFLPQVTIRPLGPIGLVTAPGGGWSRGRARTVFRFFRCGWRSLGTNSHRSIIPITPIRSPLSPSPHYPHRLNIPTTLLSPLPPHPMSPLPHYPHYPIIPSTSYPPRLRPGHWHQSGWLRSWWMAGELLFGVDGGVW